MNGILLITITVTVALVNGNNSRPCEQNYDNNAFNRFVRKHILQWYFDRSSKTAWTRYLSQMGLCNRTSQTFMEKEDLTSVVYICNGYGRRLRPHYTNLCISDSLIWVYQVYIRWDCKVERLETYPHHVIVACDKIGNQCLPVHYEPYYGQYPKANDPICRP